MPARSAPTSRPRRGIALVAALVVTGGLVACEPPPPPPAPATAVVADRDTFVVSHLPEAERGDDAVLRIMGSSDKTKVAYLSFPVDATAPVDATLRLVPRQGGFAIEARSTSQFTERTTFSDRPAVGPVVGRLGQTRADVAQTVALADVPVVGGRVNLALTTSGPYELEIVSSEGATTAGTPASAPRLQVGAAPPTTSPPTTTPPTTGPSPSPRGWRVAWSDEFNGSSIDRSKWNIYDEGTAWGAFTSTKATACPKASNASVGGGILVMRTQKANGACAGGQAQSGAALTTWGKFEQAQGRFEARVRWTAKGNNLWGGFWTHANGGPGYTKADGSELDIFEYIGKTAEPNLNRFKPAIHFNYTCNPKCMQNVPIMGHDVTAWHTYAAEWEPTVPGDANSTQIRFYLDGRQIAQFDRFGAWSVSPSGAKVLVHQGAWTNPNHAFPAPFGPDRAHKIMLSATVGNAVVDAATVARGYNPPDGHADLQVDWVRVYKR